MSSYHIPGILLHSVGTVMNKAQALLSGFFLGTILALKLSVHGIDYLRGKKAHLSCQLQVILLES